MNTNCYFCGKPCLKDKPDPRGVETGRYICHNHPMWVWHNHHAQGSLDWTNIYLAVERPDGVYGISIRLPDNVLSITHWTKYYETGHLSEPKGVLKLLHIPENFTPETAKEKLSFYLTFY